VLLDTTYMFSAVGVGLGERLDHALAAVQDAGHETWMSEISIFELLAKGAKLAKDGKLSEERLATGIRSIMGDDTVAKASAYGEGVVATSVGIRRYHKDFVDCLIVASAIEHCEALLSEEDLGKNDDLVRFVREMKPKFRFLRLNDLAGRKSGQAGPMELALHGRKFASVSPEEVEATSQQEQKKYEEGES
jgi:PIN domain nuclease of toxin-antitoxin system